ncbi:hypothetical protein F4859DRAFT_507620 [Xylaria cf. heliscus]|nr:hypothetical protein F4859DRAFT_507620 [Xylaria cf. heliscus]
MNRGRPSEVAASGSAVPAIYISTHGVTDPGEPSHPYGIQVDAVRADRDKHGRINSIHASDWLTEATVDLSRDLDTSKKELDIIKFILEEMELRPRTDRGSGVTREGQVELMRACREYSSSRCHLLRERLRQVQFWARSRIIGQQVPERAPEEWRFTDNEWRRWLSDQASSSHADLLGGSRVSPIETISEPSNEIVWRDWGPLPHILSADVWWKDL